MRHDGRRFNALDVLGHFFVGLSTKGDGQKRIIGFMKSFKVVYKRFYGLWRFSFEELSQKRKPRGLPATGSFGWVIQPQWESVLGCRDGLPGLCRQRHRATGVGRGRALRHRRRGPSQGEVRRRRMMWRSPTWPGSWPKHHSGGHRFLCSLPAQLVPRPSMTHRVMAVERETRCCFLKLLVNVRFWRRFKLLVMTCM